MAFWEGHAGFREQLFSKAAKLENELAAATFAFNIHISTFRAHCCISDLELQKSNFW